MILLLILGGLSFALTSLKVLFDAVKCMSEGSYSAAIVSGALSINENAIKHGHNNMERFRA